MDDRLPVTLNFDITGLVYAKQKSKLILRQSLKPINLKLKLNFELIHLKEELPVKPKGEIHELANMQIA
jgi:hypothetical protein